MDPRRWEEIEVAFGELVELDAVERSSRLAALGATDPALRAVVESLLAADAEADRRLAPLEASLLSPAPTSTAASNEPPPDPLGLRGHTLSHFRVLEPLGAGGMGVVYRAEDTRLGRAVALKFLLPPLSLDAAAKARFLHEAHSAAALDHPNLFTIYEVGESEDGRLFLAMALYPGETLKARLAREGPLPVGEALEIARQVGQGLSCAHAAGIVHRDLKPGNVMLLPDGTVKILDFGLAKARDQSLSESGARFGTASYMAPEQIRGEAVDARTDLWALGVVLYEMLTGRKPFAGKHEVAIAHAIIHDEPARPTALRADLPAAVENLVLRLLQKGPAERYPAAAELLADLARVGTASESAIRSVRTHWLRVSHILPGKGRRMAAAGALVLIASVPGVVLWRQASGRREASIVDRSETRPQLSSLAVLPLKNYSGDPAQEYFADGLTEELTTTLTKIEALRVIAHQSVLQFKHSDRSVPEIARLLDVKHVVDGSVLQDGDRVRITATLIDAARNTPIWGDRFERERSDILALQREVALAIARAIEIALTPQDLARLEDTTEVDPEAFDFFVKGTQARYKAVTNQDLAEARGYFARAVAKDSGYAPAYAGLATAHAFAGDEPQARLFAEKALALDPKLAETYVVLGVIRQMYDLDWAGSEESFREAIRMNPGYAEAHHELSMLLMRRRRFDEALREARRTLYLAPMSARFEDGLAQVYLYSSRYDDALRATERVLSLDSSWVSSFGEPYWVQAKAYELQGRYAKAEEAWTKCGCGDLGHLYAISGRRAEALKIVDTLKARWRAAKREGTARGIAVVYAGLGERELALDWLERGGAEKSWFMLYLGINPNFRSLHVEPRFQALLNKVGLGAITRMSGAAIAAGRTAIAVLPFQNLSAERRHAYFAAGLHDEILTQLTKVAALKVISRTSVVGYTSPNPPPHQQIASELGVRSIVEGSVQVVRDRLRVNVRLVDAATGAYVWAERYDRTLDDAFAIQSDIARQIVGAVGAVLSGAEREALAAAPTGSAEAYLLYLQGREYYTRPGYLRHNLEIAQQLYERALALDPSFALARAALSEVHGWMYWARFDHSPARAGRQREEAEAAFRLRPDLPEAHFAMGTAYYWGQLDYRRALDELAVALKGRPNDAEVWLRIAAVHRRLGNWDEVLAAFEKATQLDPRNANLFLDVAYTYQWTRRYAEALDAYDRALSLAPDLHWAAVQRGWLYVVWQGQLGTLRAVLRRLPRDADLGGSGTRTDWHARLLHWERRPDSLLQVLRVARADAFEQQTSFLPTSLYAAWAHQLRGDRAAARAAFDSARALLDSVVSELPHDERVHAARGLALAGLGRPDEALREARWLEESPLYRKKDAYGSPWVAEERARVLAQSGEAEAALDGIERLLTSPSGLTVQALRLDPVWDPIRQHPRFKALLVKYGG